MKIDYNPSSRVGRAYKLLIEIGARQTFRNEGFTESEIKKAVKFRNEYQNRSILSYTLAQELDIKRGTAKDLIRCQERMNR